MAAIDVPENISTKAKNGNKFFYFLKFWMFSHRLWNAINVGRKVDIKFLILKLMMKYSRLFVLKKNVLIFQGNREKYWYKFLDIRCIFYEQARLITQRYLFFFFLWKIFWNNL